MNADIVEIFASVQGEGPYAGLSQVFVRFFKCNMHCVWCDTPHSIGDDGKGRYEVMSLEEVTRRVQELAPGCHSVSLTGGEPLLQFRFIRELVPAVRRVGLKVYLDTNGICPDAFREVAGDMDIIAMDLKLPSSTRCRAYWKEHEEFLNIAAGKNIFIKTVISSGTSEDDIKRAARLVKGAGKDIPFILQPNFFEMRNGVVAKCVEFQKLCLGDLKDVRILPQMHKFMKMR